MFAKRRWEDPRDAQGWDISVVVTVQDDDPTFGEPIARILFRRPGIPYHILYLNGLPDLSAVGDAELQTWLDEARG